MNLKSQNKFLYLHILLHLNPLFHFCKSMCRFGIIRHYLISNGHHTFVLCQYTYIYISTAETQLAGSSERFITHYMTIKRYVQVFLTVSNVRIKVTHKLERIYKGRLRYSSIHFQALRKIMKTLSQPRFKPSTSQVQI